MSPYPMGRLQLHALAYNLANFLRTLALPAEMESRSLTTLREKVVKIGAKAIATLDTASSRWPRSLCRAISSAASWR
jgi:Transposase DDE domain group 1